MIIMNKRILAFNIVYYAVTLIFINLGRDDASSSLGYGFFIVGFWLASAVVIVFFLINKIIQPKSILDKVGVFMATPVLSIVAICLILFFQKEESSEYHFNKDGYRYKAVTVHHKGTSNVKRIEYYRSKGTNNESWLKDSTWVYFSESGDTLKSVIFKDDMEKK